MWLDRWRPMTHRGEAHWGGGSTSRRGGVSVQIVNPPLAVLAGEVDAEARVVLQARAVSIDLDLLRAVEGRLQAIEPLAQLALDLAPERFGEDAEEEIIATRFERRGEVAQRL